ncbi:exopolysaccharide biosynthesis polyprenyl glycosylphosphotransferase [bacterium]|nr:exopolysaccharide biosynthesis polyprenyl glycosylphosphotransferase [bacterium]
MRTEPLLQERVIAHEASRKEAAAAMRRPDGRGLPVRGRWLDRRAVSDIAVGIDAVAAVLVSFAIAEPPAPGGIGAMSLASAAPHIALPVAAVLAIRLAGAHRFHYAGSLRGHTSRAGLAAIAGSFIAAAVCWLAFPQTSAPEGLVTLSAALVLALTLLHAGHLLATRALTRAGRLSENVVIVGATPAAERLAQKNARERELNILGYFDDRAGRRPVDLAGAPHLGGVDDLLNWPRLPDVDRIVITVTSTAQDRVRNLIDRLRGLPQQVILVLDLEGFNPEHTSLARIADAPAAYISGAPRDFRRAAVKRCVDVAGALAIGICAAPIMLLIAAAIRLDSPGPALFRQKRHGFNNEVIRVWKFRTMRVDPLAEHGLIVQTMANDPRVTRVGKWLRRLSLDELPQILNILRGDMSLVGPRPHAVGMTAEAVGVHTVVADYAHRHRMKPGLTGWAQINGSRGPVHTADGVRERVRYDLHYIEHAGFWLDLYIIVMTLPRLLGDAGKVR